MQCVYIASQCRDKMTQMVELSPPTQEIPSSDLVTVSCSEATKIREIYVKNYDQKLAVNYVCVTY